MFAKYICLLVVVVVAVQSAPSVTSDRKCMPKQWEASIFGKVAQVNQGKGQVADFVGMTATDYSKKVTVFLESVYFEDKFVGNYTFLMTEKQTYLIDTIKMTCDKLPLLEVEQVCTDSSSMMHIGSWSVGGMMTDTYKVVAKGRTITVTFLRDSFTKMSEVIETEFAGMPQMVALQYGNMKTGVQDPSVFDIPSYC